MKHKTTKALLGVAMVAGLSLSGGIAANAAGGYIGCGGFHWPHVFSYAATGNAHHTHDQNDGAGYKSFWDTDGGNYTTTVGFYYDNWTATGTYPDAWCAN